MNHWKSEEPPTNAKNTFSIKEKNYRSGDLKKDVYQQNTSNKRSRRDDYHREPFEFDHREASRYESSTNKKVNYKEIYSNRSLSMSRSRSYESRNRSRSRISAKYNSGGDDSHRNLNKRRETREKPVRKYSRERDYEEDEKRFKNRYYYREREKDWYKERKSGNSSKYYECEKDSYKRSTRDSNFPSGMSSPSRKYHSRKNKASEIKESHHIERKEPRINNKDENVDTYVNYDSKIDYPYNYTRKSGNNYDDSIRKGGNVSITSKINEVKLAENYYTYENQKFDAKNSTNKYDQGYKNQTSKQNIQGHDTYNTRDSNKNNYEKNRNTHNPNHNFYAEMNKQQIINDGQNQNIHFIKNNLQMQENFNYSIPNNQHLYYNKSNNSSNIVTNNQMNHIPIMYNNKPLCNLSILNSQININNAHKVEVKNFTNEKQEILITTSPLSSSHIHSELDTDKKPKEESQSDLPSKNECKNEEIKLDTNFLNAFILKNKKKKSQIIKSSLNETELRNELISLIQQESNEDESDKLVNFEPLPYLKVEHLKIEEKSNKDITRGIILDEDDELKNLESLVKETNLIWKNSKFQERVHKGFQIKLIACENSIKNLRDKIGLLKNEIK